MHMNNVMNTDVQHLLLEADALLEHGKYDKAKKLYLTVTELAPYDHRGWVGMIRAQTFNFTNLRATSSYREYLMQAVKTGNPEQVAQIIKEYEEYIAKVNVLEKRAADDQKERNQKTMRSITIKMVVLAVILLVIWLSFK